MKMSKTFLLLYLQYSYGLINETVMDTLECMSCTDIGKFYVLSVPYNMRWKFNFSVDSV